ncbi:MAG: DUF3168 domain-containing protein [Aestuariivirga sp.]|uniref:DUF3168 domain-containing protein n=1 Tax=Aestuariivirga sp. TaxID=2650926 RepID=UPI0025C33361|nr:DUF3168 domain-containing protein [Aestuariivirga sp.]MCA3561495.1 DUF3168 domain-containing protein [Aestuariivirga sp.]
MALQEAMRARLIADDAVKAALGGAYVYDEAPRGAPPSYVEFTGLDTRDWSTFGEGGFEHFVSLVVRSNSRGRAQAQAISAAVEAALDGAPLTLAGHRLVNLRLMFWSVVKTGQNYGASLRFRAATEPL